MTTITALIENTCCLPDYEQEHGLSLYIRTGQHNILFDTGSGDRFIRNAEKMAVDLSQVDIAIISHGHYDHGGGLDAFIKANTKAPIYIQKTAFDKPYGRHNNRKKYIGLNQELATNPRFIFIEKSTVIDRGLQIITGVKPLREVSNLLIKKGRDLIPDPFEHEQSLIVSENGKNLLISGCSHCGIDQILSAAKATCGKIDTLLGGFHLVSYDFDKPEDMEEMDALGRRLLAEGVMCYTCHCTSPRRYSRLKKIMGDRIGYLSTGNTIVV